MSEETKWLHAWMPLADAVTAWGELGHVKPDDKPGWRIRYFAAIGLLRTVGHVLDKVDKLRSSAAKEAIDAAYKRWKADRSTHSIFWDFVEDERNLLVKEYKLGCDLDDPIDCPVLTIDGVERPDIPTIPVVFMESGAFEGEAVESLLRQAIEWWIEELGMLEGKITPGHPASGKTEI